MRTAHARPARTDEVNVGTSATGFANRLGGLRGDGGTSLIELIVGMSVLSIFLGMFTGAVVMLNQATNKAQAINLTSQQLNGAFISLDKVVRYAAAISPPGCAGATAPACNGVSSGDWYVELRTTNTGSELCTQLRVDITTQQLQKRSWDPKNLPPAGDPRLLFTPVASGITNGAVATGSTDQPFVLLVPGEAVPFQQLAVNFVSNSGSGAGVTSGQTTSRSSFTFGALNSSIPAPIAPICQEEGRP